MHWRQSRCFLPYPRIYVRQLNNINPHRNRQDSRLRRQPLWWLRHCFSACKVSAKNGLFFGQMTSGRRAGCHLSGACYSSVHRTCFGGKAVAFALPSHLCSPIIFEI
ncbi:hypothetical protein CXF95_28265 [Paraglaciecola sp. MB-3u-78]|nr:hypothetical protein CXF95_28265 [Paraglaciecola sp. MB-3u-78]